MNRRHGWLLAAAITAGVGISTSSGADAPATAPKAAEKAVQPTPISNEPVLIPGTACRDGNCAPVSACRDRDCTPRPLHAQCATPSKPANSHPPVGAYLDRLGKWFFYRAAPTPCECAGHLPAYRPPLTAWFPCKPGHCGTAPAPIYKQVIVVEPRPEAVPPLPPMPQITREDRPLIPGSSTAISDKYQEIKKPAPQSRKVPDSNPDISFRRAISGDSGLQPVDARVVEPRWERTPK